MRHSGNSINIQEDVVLGAMRVPVPQELLPLLHRETHRLASSMTLLQALVWVK